MTVAEAVDVAAELRRLLARLPSPDARWHAHVPLMLGPDGARLAKRHGAVTLAERASLGQSPADVRQELLGPFGLGDCVTMEELVNAFDPARIR